MYNASCIASKNKKCIHQNLNRRHEVHKDTKLGMRNESVNSKLSIDMASLHPYLFFHSEYSTFSSFVSVPDKILFF